MKIKSKKQGAELTSILVKGKERLHQGKEYWNRQAPILFPIVGQIKKGETIINGKTYHMGQHGFARDMEFEELEKSETVHKYRLKSNSDTLEKFPFQFELYVTYLVEKESVITKYQVINCDKQDMVFGIGAHPAFICDYSTGEYEIEFEKKEDKIEFLQLENGLLSNELAPNLLKDNKIQINKDTFQKDAVIMRKLNSTKVYLKKDDKTILEFDFTGFPYLALWSKMGAPFVCIEPWMNTTDRVDSKGDFEEKENMIKLQAKEEFTCQYQVKF